MADVYDTDGEFTVTRLRAPDSTYFEGAVHSVGTLPQPIAKAEGPAGVVGPSSQIVSEWWLLRVLVPAAPDVAWVIVDDEIQNQVVAGAASATRLYLSTFATPAAGDQTRGPLLGPGSSISQYRLPGTVQTYSTVDAPSTPRPKGLFLPLDPQDTKDSWYFGLSALSGGTTAADKWRVLLNRVRLIGYPVNAFNTGILSAVAATRGS